MSCGRPLHRRKRGSRQKEVCGGGESCGRMHLARFLGNPAREREEGPLAAPGTLRAQEGAPAAGPVVSAPRSPSG